MPPDLALIVERAVRAGIVALVTARPTALGCGLSARWPEGGWVVSTHRSTWKRRERDAARFFGTKRQVLSGSSGCESNSDSCHPRLYLECKLRASSATRSLWEQTKARAVREGKIPVVLLYDKGKPGAIVAVHQDDLAAVAVELARQSDAVSTDPRPPGQSGPGALETPR